MTNFKYDFVNEKIVGSKTAIAKASTFGTPEYKELIKMMKGQPTFGVAEKVVKRNSNKKTYKGLNCDVMYAYVQEQKDEAKMKEYESVKALGYPSLKKWFLDNYKGTFTMADLKKNHNNVKIHAVIKKEEVAAKKAAPALAVVND